MTTEPGKGVGDSRAFRSGWKEQLVVEIKFVKGRLLTTYMRK